LVGRSTSCPVAGSWSCAACPPLRRRHLSVVCHAGVARLTSPLGSSWPDSYVGLGQLALGAHRRSVCYLAGREPLPFIAMGGAPCSNRSRPIAAAMLARWTAGTRLPHVYVLPWISRRWRSPCCGGVDPRAGPTAAVAPCAVPHRVAHRSGARPARGVPVVVWTNVGLRYELFFPGRNPRHPRRHPHGSHRRRD